ncbi:MAG: hypothetical protein JSU94_16635 [Phycisphaerales bacterium]|nr:MAG: hypothetical protein JSU94_16635 [Phycisphaerales bacterium]
MDTTSKLLELAREKFGALTEAEEKLFNAAVRGEWADYRAKTEAENDPANAADWGPDRVLQADRIAWLCADKRACQFVTCKGIMARGARIDETLDLDNAEISFPLQLVDSAIPGGVALGNAEVRELKLSGTRTSAITAERLSVKGSVFLGEGFKAEGEVRLIGATIEGYLSCSNGQFINPGGEAIHADGLSVKGNVLLRDGFSAEGEVRLIGATIEGQLICSDGHFINSGSDALSADGLSVRGDVFLHEHFKAKGEVRLIGAQIKSQLDITGLDAPEEMTLDLRFAKIDTLRDEQKSWPGKGKLRLCGFAYDRIDDDSPDDVATRLRWLRLQYPSEADRVRFFPQPYEQLASVYRKMGADTSARKVLIAKNKDKARFTNLSLPQKCWYYCFGKVVGYGYKPWRALWWGLAVIIFGWLIFWAGFRADVMSPTDRAAYTSDDSPSGRHVSPDYPMLSPLMYSLDAFVPLVNFHQADYWLPDANRFSGCAIRFYLWFHIAAGWVLSTLFVVALTGLIRT